MRMREVLNLALRWNLNRKFEQKLPVHWYQDDGGLNGINGREGDV